MRTSVQARKCAEEWRNYYEMHPGLTAKEVAEHFGVNLSTVLAAWHRYGLRPNRRTTGREWQADPYGSCMATVGSSIKRALDGANEANMSNHEREVIEALIDTIKREDPRSYRLFLT